VYRGKVLTFIPALDNFLFLFFFTFFSLKNVPYRKGLDNRASKPPFSLQGVDKEGPPGPHVGEARGLLAPRACVAAGPPAYLVGVAKEPPGPLEGMAEASTSWWAGTRRGSASSSQSPFFILKKEQLHSFSNSFRKTY
jgi:hypothetical protein